MIQLQTHTSTATTPQREPVMGKNQVQNSAGGYVFILGDWKRLHRFLILGVEGGTYYATERKLTKENTQHILKLLASDGKKFVDTVVQVSQEGLAYKNDYALYALALAIGFGDNATKASVTEALPKVARTASHLTTFLTYATEFRGWGSSLRRAVANWYEVKPVNTLAYQMTKYANRNGWTQYDILNVCHPRVADDPAKNALFRYIVKGGECPVDYIQVVEQAKTADVKTLVRLIAEYRLPQELIPNQHRTDPEIWAALLANDMPMTAMIRNLASMTAYGTLTDMNESTGRVVQALLDKDRLKTARIHPLQVIAAMLTYKQGRGMRGNLTWTPVGRILDALNESFYLAFETIEPSNARIHIGLDISGSMGIGTCGGIPGLTPRVASAILSMATIRSEPKYAIGGFSDSYVNLGTVIGARMSLDEVVRNISNIPMGRTDCALPVLAALKLKHEVDAFVIYTDNETWYGNIHPFQALKKYRQEMGVNAKMIVVGMTATEFTIADPSDPRMLDVVGLSTDTPAAISAFIKE